MIEKNYHTQFLSHSCPPAILFDNNTLHFILRENSFFMVEFMNELRVIVYSQSISHFWTCALKLPENIVRKVKFSLLEVVVPKFSC